MENHNDIHTIRAPSSEQKKNIASFQTEHMFVSYEIILYVPQTKMNEQMDSFVALFLFSSILIEKKKENNFHKIYYEKN